MPSLRYRLSALLLFCCAGVAQAQFVWIAPNGTRQYSDQPPPPGTPAAKILKAPGRSAPAQETPAAAVATPAATPPAKLKAPTLAEREADYRKRSTEREESERKSQEDAGRAAKKAEYCDSLRKHQRLVESGARISDVGPDGQRRFLNDAERAALRERAAQQLNDCR
jgi:type IV secretory pathway VirB10-like protein